MRQAAREKTPSGRINLVSSSDWALLHLLPKPPEFIEDGGEMRLEVAPRHLESALRFCKSPSLHFPFTWHMHLRKDFGQGFYWLKMVWFLSITYD